MAESALSSLLARTIGDIELRLARAGAGGADVPGPALWWGLLRAVDSGGVSQRDLPAATRLSKRAVRNGLTNAARPGWVMVARQSGTAGPVVTRTAAGESAAARFQAMATAVEARWTADVGAEPADRLRAALQGIVGQLELEWPHFPISYGSADFSVTGGSFRPGRPGPPRIPPHGQDWAPVVRTGGARSVAGLPLVPLLSQALVAFVVDYSAAGGGALSIVEGLVRGFGADDVVPLSRLPPFLGVNGTRASGLERHGIVTVEADPHDRRMPRVRLTALARRGRDAYGVLVGRVEQQWAEAYGGDLVSELRAALEQVAPRLDAAARQDLLVRWVK